MQYRVLSPVSDGNGRHEVGELIELCDQDAKEMLALKAVEPHTQAFGDDAKKTIVTDSGSVIKAY